MPPLKRKDMWASFDTQAAHIEIIPNADNRSYWINSDKIKDVLGFVPKFTVSDAIKDLVKAFKSGLLPDPMSDLRYSNVKRLIQLGVK